jgi:hypothetical protein
MGMMLPSTSNYRDTHATFNTMLMMLTRREMSDNAVCAMPAAAAAVDAACRTLQANGANMTDYFQDLRFGTPA